MARRNSALKLSSRVLAKGSRALARSSLWLDRLSRLQRPTTGEYPPKLNLGCGYDKREGYLNVDVDPACAPDLLIVDGDYSSIPVNYFNEVLAKDVLEHVPRARTVDLLLDFADYLVDGGKLIIQTSSILHVAAELKGSKQYAYHHGWTICLFGNQQHPGDFHYTGFTEVTLHNHLIAAGFTVESLELREGWMFYVEATKTSDWTSALKTKDLTDREFVVEAHQAALYREAGERGILNCVRALREGVTRKQLLKKLFSTPERLFKTADRNKQRIEQPYVVCYTAFTHNHARIENLDSAMKSLALRVETDDVMYSYAVSFALDPLSLDHAGEIRVVVDLEVEAGVIGVACTTLDYSSFVDDEVFVPAGVRHEVYVGTGGHLAAHHLVVRNMNPDGRSVASIRGIDVRRLPLN